MDTPRTVEHRWWVSWYAEHGPFTYHGPWWISGAEIGGADTVCAAVQAPTPFLAQCVIVAAHDDPPAQVRWRFVEARDDDWSPFSERFPRAEWMKWPLEVGTEA